jgi:hypothetical protein
MREPRDAAPVLPVSIPKRHASASVPTSEPEVIVLAEEREAFAKFVAEVPEQPQVVVGLTHPAPDTLDAPIEIALLHIDRLEVNLLNPVASQ